MVASHVLLAVISKVPFYLAGGLLALWAVILAALGLSSERFPGSKLGSRGVMGISLILMLVAMTTAVATAERPAHSGKSELKPVQGGEASSASTVPAAPTPKPAAGSAGGAASNTIAVQADPQQLKYTTTELTAKAGKDTIDFTNPAPIPHNVKVETAGGKLVGGTKTITGGKTSATLTLAAGTYTYYCSIPGHRQAGMEGKLTVK